MEKNKRKQKHFYRILTAGNETEHQSSGFIRKSFQNVLKIAQLQQTIRSHKKENLSEVSKVCRIKIVQEIGSGSFSFVYSAKVSNHYSLMAVKKISLDNQYVNREEFFAKKLKNPFIVKFYDTYYTNQNNQKYLNILMEKHSHNLAQAMAVEKFNRITTKLYLYQMLRSLSYLHSQNICHRDIKPHNFLITKNKVVLCDFGSAKMMENNNSVCYLFSRQYRAPELLFGYPQYNKSVDIWALGCIAAEMTLKKPLFQGNSCLDQILKILQILGTPNWQKISFVSKKLNYLPKLKGKRLEYVFVGEVEEQFINWIKKLLVIEPNERYEALEALADPYFDEIREESVYWTIKKNVDIPNLFYFPKRQIIGKEQLQSKLVPFWVKEYCKEQNIALQNFK